MGFAEDPTFVSHSALVFRMDKQARGQGGSGRSGDRLPQAPFHKRTKDTRMNTMGTRAVGAAGIVLCVGGLPSGLARPVFRDGVSCWRCSQWTGEDKASPGV